MGHLDTTSVKKLAAEPAQVIDFLCVISDLLKQQRRHFDDAVVTHCIRLIHDYVDERGAQVSTEGKQLQGNKSRRL